MCIASRRLCPDTTSRRYTERGEQPSWLSWGISQHGGSSVLRLGTSRVGHPPTSFYFVLFHALGNTISIY